MKGENQQIVDIKGESTGNTDDSQEEGIDRFDKEGWAIRPMCGGLQKNFWNVIKVRIQRTILTI